MPKRVTTSGTIKINSIFGHRVVPVRNFDLNIPLPSAESVSNQVLSILNPSPLSICHLNTSYLFPMFTVSSSSNFPTLFLSNAKNYALNYNLSQPFMIPYLTMYKFLRRAHKALPDVVFIFPSSFMFLHLLTKIYF